MEFEKILYFRGIMRSVYRLLDAVSNRVAEGLRVVEDVCRFLLDDDELGSKLKHMRQNLRVIVASAVRTEILLTERDTAEDLGTKWEGAYEYKRADSAEIVTANFKRIQEGLRSIEELLKQFHADAVDTYAKQIEQMRYNSYVMEKKIYRAVNINSLKNLIFTLVFDPDACLINPWELLESVLCAGVDSVQYRVKNYLEKEQKNLDFICKTHEICQKHNAPLIINDRADWTLIADADGLHVGQKDLAVDDARKILKINQFVGLSIANEQDLRVAKISKADYFGVGALFKTETKFYDKTPGLELYKNALLALKKPVFGIGGITENNLSVLKKITKEIGKNLRICVSSAILKSENPAQVAENMRRILDE